MIYLLLITHDLDIFHAAYFNCYTSVFSFHSLGLLLGLRFYVLSCPRGQDSLVSFSLLLCMSKLTCQMSCDSMIDLKNCHPQKSLLSKQHVMKSKSRIICIKYITYVTSITACRYNLSQNRLKFNRFYIT